ncbi:unnamed protein product [Caenorhabditis auriculariae]|uniref:Uncharacterized protein n=1 Tax=Caenorhabditis auriculariae TaxID=2777116 RepID=A0A8S1H6B1_9PELO|nr:unnamed protein product [Caenorhabditis auriculariae]
MFDTSRKIYCRLRVGPADRHPSRQPSTNTMSERTRKDSETSSDSWSIVDDVKKVGQDRLTDDDDVGEYYDENGELCEYTDESEEASDLEDPYSSTEDEDSSVETEAEEQEEEVEEQENQKEEEEEEDDDDEDVDEESEVDEAEDEIYIVDENEKEVMEGAAKYFVSPACIPERFSQLCHDLEWNLDFETTINLIVILMLPLYVVCFAYYVTPAVAAKQNELSLQSWGLPVGKFWSNRTAEDGSVWYRFDDSPKYCWKPNNKTKVEISPASYRKPIEQTHKKSRVVHRNFSSYSSPMEMRLDYLKKLAIAFKNNKDVEENWEAWIEAFRQERQFATYSSQKTTALSKVQKPPTSVRRLPRVFKPRYGPCFEKNLSFAPCRSENNWPSVYKNEDFQSKRPQVRRFAKRQPRSEPPHPKTNYAPTVYSKKASQSMRSNKNKHQGQCDGRQQRYLRPQRPCIQRKHDLPCTTSYSETPKRAPLVTKRVDKKKPQKEAKKAKSHDWFTQRSKARATMRHF